MESNHIIMKKTLIIFFYLSILLFGCKTNWIDQTEESIENIQESALLVKETDISTATEVGTVKIYETGDHTRIRGTSKIDTLIDISWEYHLNDSIIRAELMSGVYFKVYKREREENESYASLMDRRTYFKNKNEGIEKFREIDVFDFEDFDSLQKELSKKEFTIKELGARDYSKVQKQYNNLLKKS